MVWLTSLPTTSNSMTPVREVPNVYISLMQPKMSTSILSTLAPSVTGINYLPLSRLSRNSGEAFQVCLPSSCDPTMRLNNMYIVLTGDLGHFICLSGIAVLYFLFLSFSIYCLALAFEHYRQVYIVHSGMQDESLQVTISKLP